MDRRTGCCALGMPVVPIQLGDMVSTSSQKHARSLEGSYSASYLDEV